MVKAKTGSQNVLFTSINTDKEWHDSVMRKLGISHGRHSLSLDHMPCFITTPSITDSLKVLAKKQKLSSLAVVGSNHSYACFICGERPVFITDGEKMWPEKDCEYPDGILLKFELNVPSGEMVVASDLREHFNTDEHYELDNRMARVKTCLAIAKSGCAFLIVGNRITGIYRVGKDKFVASKPGEDSRTGKLVEAKGKRVATVITDSDSYSIVDGDEYKHRECEGEYEVTKLKVRPGVYLFTHYYHLLDPDKEGEPIIFTNIDWVRPPGPVKEYPIQKKP